MIVVITGPVRSGKSRRATRVARDFGLPVTYVATARVDPADPEMNARVAFHRAERDTAAVIELWQPGVGDLPDIILGANEQDTLLVDSLGTWLAGHMLDLEALAAADPVAAALALDAFARALVACAAGARARLVFVAEETGWGVVPVSVQGRLFRDALGRLVQALGGYADRVELVVAGFAVDVKTLGTPV